VNRPTAQRLTFYAYRAQGDEDYHVENNNLANLPGVLKYLHYEVVSAQERQDDAGVCARHYGITRILRFKLSMKNPQRLVEQFGEQLPQFGPFSAFDQGQCTSCVDGVATFTNLGGYYVGCQKQSDAEFGYGETAAWYSLPGACPSRPWLTKDAACSKEEPGGECPPHRPPDGSPACTWRLESAGELRLDELAGIDDYHHFCTQEKVEYSPGPGGVATGRSQGGVCFWDDRGSRLANQERVATVRTMFKHKYPSLAEEMLGPLCDF